MAFTTTAEITVNGQTIDLGMIAGTDTQLSGTALAEWGSVELSDVSVGELAYVWARGAMRKGVVTGKGRKLIEVTYTTQSAVELNERFGNGLTVTATKRAADYVWVHRPQASAPDSAPVAAPVVIGHFHSAQEAGEALAILSEGNG